MKKKVYQVVILIGVLPFVMFILLDYLDIPSFIGLRITSLNYDLFGAVLNAFVVIVLYIITFIIVDKRQIKKDENAKQTANILLLYTYKQCKDTLALVNDQNILDTYIVPKVDFNKTDADSAVIMNLKNNPFIEHSKILDFAATGVVDSLRLSRYYQIMDLYKSYISLRITFFDIYMYAGNEHRDFQNTMSVKKNKIESLLSAEIKGLEESVGVNEKTKHTRFVED